MKRHRLIAVGVFCVVAYSGGAEEGMVANRRSLEVLMIGNSFSGLERVRPQRYTLADGIQKLFTRFGKWNAKLDLKKVLVKPSPQLEFAFATGDG